MATGVNKAKKFPSPLSLFFRSFPPLSLTYPTPLTLSPYLPFPPPPPHTHTLTVYPLSITLSLSSRPPGIDPSLAQPRIELGPPALEVVCLPLRYRTVDAGGNSNLYTSTCLHWKSRSGTTFKVARKVLYSIWGGEGGEDKLLRGRGPYCFLSVPPFPRQQN